MERRGGRVIQPTDCSQGEDLTQHAHIKSSNPTWLSEDDNSDHYRQRTIKLNRCFIEQIQQNASNVVQWKINTWAKWYEANMEMFWCRWLRKCTIMSTSRHPLPHSPFRKSKMASSPCVLPTTTLSWLAGRERAVRGYSPKWASRTGRLWGEAGSYTRT